MKKRVCDICDAEIGLCKNDYIVIKEKCDGVTGLTEPPFTATIKHEICKDCYNSIIGEIEKRRCSGC